MKKVLLSLLAVAALALSCQNYDDEFDALNSKIASLESQINSLAELKTAVTGVQSSVSSLQSAVNAAQAAAAAAATAAADAAAEAEAASSASADAAAAAAAAAAANAAAIAELASSIADIAADLVDLDTAISGATTPEDLAALKAELNTTLAALNALIEANSDQIADILLNNASLATSLAALGVDVQTILDTVYTYEGNLTINDRASLAFAQNLGGKVKAIKGNVVIDVNSSNYSDIAIADVNAITKLITNVNGNVSVNGYNASVDLSALQNVTGDYIVTGYDALDDSLVTVGDDVYFNYDGAYTSKIVTADNIYLYLNAASTTAPVKSGTTSIEFLDLSKASGLQTVDTSGVATHTSGGTAHTSGGSISVSSGSITGAGVSTTNALVLNSATTSVKVGQAPINYVSGLKLATLELHYASAGTTTSPSLPFLTINGASLTSATVKAKKVSGAVSVTAKTTGSVLTMDDVATLTSVTSNAATNSLKGLTSATSLTLTGATSNDLSALASATTLTSAAASNTLTALATVGTLTLSVDTTPSLPALTKATGNITLAKATTMSFPLLATAVNITGASATGTVSFPALTSASVLTFAKATGVDAKLATVSTVDLDGTKDLTIDLASVTFTGTGTVQFPDIASIKTLNLHKQATDIASRQLAKAAKMTSITILGKDNTVDVYLTGSTSDFEKLESVTLGGTLNSAKIYDMPKLTTTNTSGVIHLFDFTNNDLVTTGLTMSHAHDNDLGAYLRIVGNAKLETFTTSVDKVYVLQIQSNPLLEEFDASSIQTIRNFTEERFNSGAYTTLSVVVKDNYTIASTGKFVGSKGMLGGYISDTATTDEKFKENSLASLKPFLTDIYTKAYVGTSPILAGMVSASGLTIDLAYLSDTTSWEVTNGATAGTAQVRTIVTADVANGEIADILVE